MFGDILFFLIIILVVIVMPLILKERNIVEVKDLPSPFLEGREWWWEEEGIIKTSEVTDPSYSFLPDNIFHDRKD
jgi:hypothetical protein